MDDMSCIPPAYCAKVFIHRDYNEGTAVQLQNKFPPELDGRIEQSEFERTITHLNQMYADAEALGGRTYCEGCMACLTAYLSYICIDTYYEKVLKKIAKYIEDENKKVYVPRGLMLIDPAERGLRVLEICIMQEPTH